MKDIKHYIEKALFACKWLLVVAYFNLVLTLAYIIYLYVMYRFLTKGQLIDTLESVDIVMIINLVKSIITGSYNSFVSKTHGQKGENVSSGALKVKMGSSLIGISSVLLLQQFLTIDEHTKWSTILMYLAIHGAFLVSTLVLAVTEYLHVKSEHYAQQHTEYEQEDDLIIDMLDSPDRV